jgi:endonuclease/exonuclease/phosphatase family metal-dependent hydrolase
MEINVMTFNIHHGKGTDGNVQLERIVDIIKKSKANIIGINEVDRFFSKRSHFMDQLTWLAKELGMHSFFSPSISKKARDKDEFREYGNGLLSSFPINEAITHSLKSSRLFTEGRSVLEAILNVNSQQVKAIVSHLSLHSKTHQNQTEFIINKVKEDGLPSLILGDWNMKPGHQRWHLVTESLQDVWFEQSKRKDIGNGYTFPSQYPRSRIDYIFTTQEFITQNAVVVKSNPTASDHLPVLASLRLP